MDVPNVTVTVLPVSLSLVHIPRYRLNHFAHPIIKQILRPSPTFLNISCNPTEVSIIAPAAWLSSFARIARKDERRILRAAKNGRVSSVDPVKVSSSWSALQIDSHGDQLGDASARIQEISSLLSGISILYQSSYTTDFIFVQSSKLSQVLHILRNAGFVALSGSSDGGDDNELSSHFCSLACSSTSSLNSSSDSEELTWPYKEESTAGSVLIGMDESDNHDQLRHLHRSRRGTAGSSMSVQSLLFSKTIPAAARVESLKEIVPPLPSLSQPSPEPIANDILTTPGISEQSANPDSPPRTPVPAVEVVAPDIAVVGLSEQSDHAEAWTMKLIKLLLFPETLKRTCQPSSSASPSPLLGLGLGSNNCGSDSESSSLASDSDEGEVDESDSENGEGTNSSASSVPQTQRSLGGSRSSNLRRLTLGRPSQLSEEKQKSSSRSTSSSKSSSSQRLGSAKYPPTHIKRPCPQSPSHQQHNMLSFFSLTRTSDGTSLATDIHLLAELFPPGDRYLVFCADEFERVEEEHRRLDSGYYEGDDDAAEGAPEDRGFLKCLHIDLAAFPLDKHGFVNRFSDVLHKNSINHLYSSTFKTANLLVNQGDVAKAKALLREC